MATLLNLDFTFSLHFLIALQNFKLVKLSDFYYNLLCTILSRKKKEMKFTRNYLGKVINTLGAQAARNMKSKRGLVGIPELISELRAKNKTEMKQLKSSVNYLIQSGLVTLVLPEAMKKSLREVGLGASELCGGGGGCCNPCCDRSLLPTPPQCGGCL